MHKSKEKSKTEQVSSMFLNALSEGAPTIHSGKLFQIFTILWVNELAGIRLLLYPSLGFCYGHVDLHFP